MQIVSDRESVLANTVGKTPGPALVTYNPPSRNIFTTCYIPVVFFTVLFSCYITQGARHSTTATKESKATAVRASVDAVRARDIPGGSSQAALLFTPRIACRQRVVRGSQAHFGCPGAEARVGLKSPKHLARPSVSLQLTSSVLAAPCHDHRAHGDNS